MLESMNRSAVLQLRLQQMVEGLSVVAISNYAASLAGYPLAPLAPILATRCAFRGYPVSDSDNIRSLNPI